MEFDGIESAEILRADKVSKNYGSNTILREVSLTLSPDSRIVITGPNGSGKSTLLQILSGVEKPDGGRVTRAPGIRLGYLRQEPRSPENKLSVFEYYRRGLTGHDEDFVPGLVNSGLFKYDEIHKPVRELSLGQIRKLEIARIIASEPNVLILDEPTNHLSLDVLESFEEAIDCFKGPILAVSHDRRFIRQFNGEALEIADGQISW
jgi:macrolide transport system ATP-binding/permease protein